MCRPLCSNASARPPTRSSKPSWPASTPSRRCPTSRVWPASMSWATRTRTSWPKSSLNRGCAIGLACKLPESPITTRGDRFMNDMTDEEKQLVEWLADMNEEDAIALSNKMLLEDKKDPMRVLDLCRAAMDIVGKRFEE